MAPNVMVPMVMAPVIAFALYRRVRRQFGRQRIRTRAMWIRVGLLSVVLGLFSLAGLHDPRLAAGVLGGALAGVAIGMVGLRLTRFDVTGGDDTYTPNPWIGGLLTALLVGRLAYRFLVVMPAMQVAGHAAAGASGFGAYQRSPLTMAVFGLLIGYYISYYAGLLVHHRRLLARVRAKPDQPWVEL